MVFAEPQTLRLLVWEGYAPEAQRKAFQLYIQEKYNVELHLEVSYISGMADCYTALRLKKADILSPAHNRINDKRFRMIDLGLLLPLNLDNIPNYVDVRDDFKNLDHLTYNDKAYGTPFAWGPYGLLYNADLVQEPPTSWKVLWSPRYRNQYVVSDLAEHNVYITALALGYAPEDLGNFDALNNERFRNMLGRLVKNSHKFWQGVDTASDLKGLSLAASWGFSLPELERRGENWKWAPLQEKIPGWIDNYVISHTLKDRPQLKRIAEEWINYSLSPEFQAEVVVKSLSARPVNLKAKELLSNDVTKVVDLDDSPRNRFVLMLELDRRTRNGFNLLWDEAVTQREEEQRKTQ